MSDNELESLIHCYGPTTVRAYQILTEHTPYDDVLVDSLLFDVAILTTKTMRPPAILGRLAHLLLQNYGIKTKIVVPGQAGGDPALLALKPPTYRLVTESRHVMILLGDILQIHRRINAEWRLIYEVSSMPLTDPQNISIIVKNLR